METNIYYPTIDRKSFKIARFICDSVLGTEDIFRPVEDKTLTKPVSDFVFYTRESHTMIHVDRQAEFWNDVKSVKAMLDSDGNYKGLTQPREIAEAIVMSGICWVNAKMVKQAKRHISTNCRRIAS